MKNSPAYSSSDNSKATDASGASKASTASGASKALHKRILIITYYWPPCGGAGVQRWLKFSKYMPGYGWEPVILTVDPACATFPAIDNSLEDEIRPELRVEKTKAINYFAILSREKGSKISPSAGFASGETKSLLSKIARFARGNFFIPDPRRGWNRFALKRAKELIKELNITHVITSSPPHSTQLIGLKLKKWMPSLNWVADLRDPWTDIYYYKMFMHTLPAKIIDRSYEKAVMKTADFISTAGKLVSKSKIEDYQLDKSKLIMLLNGFDESDFSDIEIKKPSIFTITYAGSVSEQYPLTSFVKALKEALSLSKNIHVRFIGSTDEKIINLFNQELPPEAYRFMPYSDHKEAIKYMLNSHMLLLIIPEHTKNKTIIPGKIFEYMRSGNPVLSIGPSGSDVERILKENNAGKNFEPGDSQGMLNYIITEYDRKSNEVNNSSNQYNRKIQIGDFLKKVSG